MGKQPSQSLATYQEGLEHACSCSSLSSRGLCLPSPQQASHVPWPLLLLSMSWHPGPVACGDHGRWTVAVNSNGELTAKWMQHRNTSHTTQLNTGHLGINTERCYNFIGIIAELPW